MKTLVDKMTGERKEVANYEMSGETLDLEDKWASKPKKTLNSPPTPSIKERYQKFINETSFTAIAKIHNSSSCMKRLVWLVLVLSMFGWLTVQCLWLFQKFFRYPVEVRFEMVSVSKLQFPSVTVCNVNPLKRSMVNKTDSPFLLMTPVLEIRPNDLLYNKAVEMLQETYNVSGNTTIDWKQVMIDSKFSMWQALQDEDTARQYYTTMAQKHEAAMLYATVASYMSPHELEKYGHKKNEFLMSCSFAGFQCSPANFTYLHSRTFGNCYTFNSYKDPNPPIVSYHAGATFGLHLELNIEQIEYINSLSPASGVVISIHQRGVQPFPEDDGIFISPGTSTYIGLKRVLIKRLPPPHALCSKKPNRHDWYMQRFGVQYDKKTCMKSCVQSIFDRECQCALPYSIMPKGATVCNFTDEVALKCIHRARGFFDVCKRQCPDSCREIIYEKTISMSQWPSEKYENFLEEQIQQTNSDFLDDDLRESSDDNLVKVQIYFEDLVYEEIEQQKAYEFQNLISDVGGQLGLWLGLSAITIGELMEFIGAVFKTITKKLIKKRQKVDKVTPFTLNEEQSKQ